MRDGNATKFSGMVFGVPLAAALISDTSQLTVMDVDSHLLLMSVDATCFA